VIADVKQRWSVIGWVAKKLLSLAPPRFESRFMPLVQAAIAVVSTHHQHWARVVAYSPFSLCVIHKEGLYPNSEDINRLMVIIQEISFSIFSPKINEIFAYSLKTFAELA
jgi:hypothetical protein